MPSTPAASVTATGRQAAFTEAVNALQRDMPILMHGSGDVLPSEVNRDTCQLLSELTIRYIGELVDAAVDAHHLLTDGIADKIDTKPPPPRFPVVRKPPPPRPPSPVDDKKDDKSIIAAASSGTSKSSKRKKEKDKEKEKQDAAKALAASLPKPRTKKRPRQLDVEYWDEPLREPKIVKRDPMRQQQPYDAETAVAADRAPAEENELLLSNKPVHIDEWVGVAGVDLWEQSRSRVAHVRMPSAIGVQCFIFPICHDGFLYGKVMQVQASRRAIAPVLMDSVLLDLVRTEGALARKRQHAPKKGSKRGADKNKDKDKNKDDDDAVEEEEDEEPVEQEDDDEEELHDGNVGAWPGLEFLLPVHQIKRLTER